MRELQKTGKIGRIEVAAKYEDGTVLEPLSKFYSLLDREQLTEVVIKSGEHLPLYTLKIVDGEFRFTGQSVPVETEGNVLDYLKRADVYNSKADIYNGFITFSDNFFIKDQLEQVDEVLSIIDRHKLEQELDDKGYAFLMDVNIPYKYRDYKDKGFIANTNRVIQERIYQKLKQEQKWDFNVRHFKLQESVELMLSDEDFKEKNYHYWLHNSEVLQKLVKQSVSSYKLIDDKLEIITTDPEILTPKKAASVWSYWGIDDCPYVNAIIPLYRSERGIAALKKVEPKKIA